MPGFLHISTTDSDMVARSIVQARFSLPLSIIPSVLVVEARSKDGEKGKGME
jgi:hypothetical protein